MPRVMGLGELEAAVMDRVWAAGRPMTVRDVLIELTATRELAYTTVMTVLDNLHKKGWLRREMVSRAWVYVPVATREQYSAQLMESALNASADSSVTLMHFVQAIGQDEIEALQAALLQAQARQGSAASDAGAVGVANPAGGPVEPPDPGAGAGRDGRSAAGRAGGS